MRDVITVFDYLIQRDSKSNLFVHVLDPHSSAYQNYRDAIEKAELFILAKLGFSVHVEHPHGYLLNILNSLSLTDNAQLVQKAWNVLNDA
jgi:ACT domain-containing protein